jgi:hypothetical protein
VGNRPSYSATRNERMNDRQQPTQEDLRLFGRIAEEVRRKPDEYREAGKWLDEYCSGVAYRQRIEQRLSGMKRNAVAGQHPPSPDVWHLEQKLKQEEVPHLYNLFADAYHFLIKECEGRVCVPEEHARRILLVTWLLTDNKAEGIDVHITRLQDWAWESTTDMPGEESGDSILIGQRVG